MLRSPDCPWSSWGWTLPKKAALSLMSSMYSISTPVRSVNCASELFLPGST